MSAYVISEVEVTDPVLMGKYRTLAEDSIAKYGGRYLVRGASIDVVEGEWPPEKSLIIVEFPTMENARKWYASPEYAEALAVRKTALRRRLIFCEGLFHKS